MIADCVPQVNQNADYLPLGMKSIRRQTVRMALDAEKQRAAIRAFMTREKIKPRPWETASGLSDGTLRKFLEGTAKTTTMQTLEKLAAGASAFTKRKHTVSEILGEAPQGLSETQSTFGQSDDHNSVSSGAELLQSDDNNLPSLLVWKSVPSAGNRLGGFVLMRKSDGEARRPDFLESADKAFAFKVLDRENDPVFRIRDILLVDPEDAIDGDDDCVFTGDPTSKTGALSLVGRFLRQTPTLWIMRQYAATATAERELPKREYPNAWRIVGRYYRR